MRLLPLTPEMLAAFAGAVLSAIFKWYPKAKTWFDSLAPNARRLVMIGLLVLVSLAIFAGGCGGILDYSTCDLAGAWGLIQVLVAAIIANQVAFLLLPNRAK